MKGHYLYGGIISSYEIYQYFFKFFPLMYFWVISKCAHKKLVEKKLFFSTSQAALLG